MRVYDAERTSSRDNKGNFTHSGIPLAPRGASYITVLYEINADSILKITTEDKTTERKNTVTINSKRGGLSREVDEMIQAAERFKPEDDESKKKDEIEKIIQEARMYTSEDAEWNELNDYVKGIRNAIKCTKIGSRLAPADKKKIKKDIRKALDWLDTNQHAKADKLEDKMKELVSSWHPIINNSNQCAGADSNDEYRKTVAKNKLSFKVAFSLGFVTISGGYSRYF